MNDRNSDYVFLSYSHNADIKELLALFEALHYNIVYDDSISYGEKWDMNVRRYLKSEKCKGVIFLFGEDAVISHAIQREVDLTMLFRRKHFLLFLDNKDFAELRESLSGRMSSEEEETFDIIEDSFPEERIFVKMRDLSPAKLKQVFDEWGLRPEEDEQLVQVRYSSRLSGEKERLDSQQRGYYAFDKKALDLVTATFNRDDLCVLDLGCANGALTYSRFCEETRISKVIGVDCNAEDIEEAKSVVGAKDARFAFYTLDLESPDLIEELNAILRQNGVEKADIVFSALTLHHLKDPSLLLLKLYDVMSDEGKIVVRGSDDGGKLCYPRSELLRELMDRYGKIVSASDRSNGRKLYSQLYNAGYVDIKMLYSVVDTCGKDRREREWLYKVGLAFRLSRIDEMLACNPDNERLRAERDWFERTLTEFKNAFADRSFWYCNTSYIAIAGVK